MGRAYEGAWWFLHGNGGRQSQGAARRNLPPDGFTDDVREHPEGVKMGRRSRPVPSSGRKDESTRQNEASTGEGGVSQGTCHHPAGGLSPSSPGTVVGAGKNSSFPSSGFCQGD